ncbi:hypothetical protein ACVWZK_007560 [Bradyrhizobium sp. GM0.4]
MPTKNSTPSRQPPRSWPPAANRMTFPARTIFFRSISRPIMNSMKIRPSSEMTLIDSCDLTQPAPNGPMQKPAIR